MARYLLLAGIFAFTSVNLHAQENASRDTAAALPNFVTQKLSLPPAGPAFQLGEATRMPETTAKSILYVGSHNRDSFNLDLPQMKNKNFEFRLQTGKNQPLYWQSIHYQPRQALTPTTANPEYGYMNWFLNTGQKLLPDAPATAFVHIGNGANFIYVDPEHELVAVVRWIDPKAMDGMVRHILAAVKK